MKFERELSKVAKKVRNCEEWITPKGVSISGGNIDEKEWHLDRIFVPEDQRKKGLAKETIKLLMQVAKKSRVDISLTALPDEGSCTPFHDKWIKTFRALGFETDYGTLSILLQEDSEEIRQRDLENGYNGRDQLIFKASKTSGSTSGV